MGKATQRSRQKRKRPLPDAAEASFQTWEAVLFLLGVLIIFFAFGTVASTLQSVCWRLKTQWYYQEGHCRVVNATVERMDGNWVVDVEHRVEIEGRQYRPTTNTEEERPSASTKEEAEQLLRRYQVGQLYPCWYDAADPNRHSVLLRDGLNPWEPLTFLWLSPLLASPGILLCAWTWRRLRARRA
jgi:hypothetical protein